MAEAPEYITVQGTAQLTIRALPVVTLPSALTIVRNGVTVGVVAASYDFSGCPTEFHDIAIQCVTPTTRTLLLPLEQAVDGQAVDVRPMQSRSLWQRIRGVLYG